MLNNNKNHIEQLLGELQKSTRWGCNKQPSMETVCDVLSQLPVIRVEMTDKRGDELEVVVVRPLNQHECFLLFELGFDGPDQVDEEQLIFDLWWE